MWGNLLSGTVGSIIGVAGAVLIAYLTVERTRHHQASQAEKERQIATSGQLAYRLVAVYDELKATSDRGTGPDSEALGSLLPFARAAVQSIVVDAP